MVQKGFSISESVGFGWRQFKEHAWFFILMILFAIVVGAIPHVITSSWREETPIWQKQIASLAGWILQVIFTMGFVRSSLDCAEGIQPTFARFFKPVSKFISFIIAEVLYTIAVFFGLLFFLVPAAWGPIVGTLLLLFPGIYFAIRFFFFPYFIIDKGQGPVESLRSSSELTYGVKWDLVGLVFATFLIRLIGIIVFVVGLLVAYPIVWIAYAHVYRVLVDQLSGSSSSSGWQHDRTPS